MVSVIQLFQWSPVACACYTLVIKVKFGCSFLRVGVDISSFGVSQTLI